MTERSIIIFGLKKKNQFWLIFCSLVAGCTDSGKQANGCSCSPPKFSCKTGLDWTFKHYLDIHLWFFQKKRYIFNTLLTLLFLTIKIMLVLIILNAYTLYPNQFLSLHRNPSHYDLLMCNCLMHHPHRIITLCRIIRFKECIHCIGPSEFTGPLESANTLPNEE